MNLLFWIVVSFVPGFLGRKFRPGDWYAGLDKAPWTPPNIAFPIVWSALYLVIGVAAWLVFRDGVAMRRGTLALFLAQLTLNGLWSWIFFGQHQVGWALLDLAALWILALATLLAFWVVSPLAGQLLIPYLVWLSIALSLNGYIYFRQAAGS